MAFALPSKKQALPNFVTVQKKICDIPHDLMFSGQQGFDFHCAYATH